MLTSINITIIGIASAVILRKKKIRLEAVVLSGLILAILMDLFQGWVSLFTDFFYIILYTLDFFLCHLVVRRFLQMQRHGYTKEQLKKTGIPLLLLLILLAYLCPIGFGKISYRQKDDGRVLMVDYKNARTIWKYLRNNLGCSRAAAAGVLGNMYAESEYRPDIIESNDVGHGIGQWSWDRWYGDDGLEAYAQSKNKEWSDMKLQLSFLRHEIVDNKLMDAYYPGGFFRYKHLLRVNGEGGSAQVFFYSFEYGDVISYDEFVSDEFEDSFATRSKRKAVANSIFRDKRRFP